MDTPRKTLASTFQEKLKAVPPPADDSIYSSKYTSKMSSPPKLASGSSPGSKSSTPRKIAPLSREDSLNSPTIQPSLTSMFSTYLPKGFFQSRNEIRTWGAEHLTDPSVQPRQNPAPTFLFDSNSLLPGYGPESVKYMQSLSSSKFVTLAPPGSISDHVRGPVLSKLPLVEIERNPAAQQLGSPDYNFQHFSNYKMDYHPYVNALMTPRDAAGLYYTANMFVGYPYGVPAVEENEAAAIKTANSMCWFGC